MRAIRILAGLAALGAGAGAVWFITERSETARLRAQREQLERERRELAQVVDRLTRERRIAEVIVTRQQTDPTGRITETQIEFIELDRDGHPLPPRTFCVPGRVVYFDALVIKFDEREVASGDPLRGQSLLLFRRIFSETLAPQDGPQIDSGGDVPDVYRVGPTPSPFEQRLWKRFWEYVSNPEAARADGVRVAQGEAVYAPMAQGQRWTLTLEHDGGMNLRLTSANLPTG